ncbi:MAG: hypothetical protein ACI39E_05165 [Acutalibacteraceae bacterium]
MSMIISIVSIAALSVTALYMFVRARFMATRRVAGVALGMAVCETAMAGLLSGVTNPTVMGLLIAARVTVLVCCVLAMRRDRERAKMRARRRNRFTVDLYNAEYPLKVVRRKSNAEQVSVVA